MMCSNHNNLVLPTDQYVEMNLELAHTLIDMYGLDGSLETVVDEDGNESYTEDSQERFDSFHAEADQILFALGFTREEDQIETTTYTIWFQDGEGRKEFLTEQQMREESERYSFDAEEVIQYGEVFFWRIGVKPYANPSHLDDDDISGGCFKVEGGAS